MVAMQPPARQRLRAMQLRRHPRVFLAALGLCARREANADISLADAVAQLQPAMVLVLGHVAARAAWACRALGRLHAGRMCWPVARRW